MCRSHRPDKSLPGASRVGFIRKTRILLIFGSKEAHLKLRLVALAAALCLAQPAAAQHLGDVSLQTTTANLASAVNCSGAAQNYITGVSSGFSNLGQTRHILTVA